MRMISLLFLFFGVRCFDSSGQINDDSPLFINATMDMHLNINVFLQKKTQFSGSVTGYKIYFTRDASQTLNEYKQWEQEEVLSNNPSYNFMIDANRYSITPSNIYRIRAAIYFNHIESVATSVITVSSKDAAPKAPLIINTKILHNSSVLIYFVPSDDVDLIENYTLLYKQQEEEDWSTINFKSDVDGKVLLDGLTPNRTYDVKMFVTGGTIQGATSNQATFTTNSTALALVKTEPEDEWQLDPQTSEPLSIKCTVKSVSSAVVHWKVNGIKVSVDSSFYTVYTTVHEEYIESTIRAKSRTRSAKFTCLATNEAGDSFKDVNVIIKGPGSPPSEITLVAEKRGYTISWEPPSHPNGQITKYVVYHTLNREDPLSDWKKIDLDGSEKFVRVIMDTEESFYGRIQAATDLGPGIISDIVAMERDTQPISVSIELNGEFAETMIVDPRERVSIQCTARGKPRPSISVAISDRENSSDVEVDIWNRLQATSSAGVVSAMHNFSILTSKFVHCRAKNSAGSNYSTIEMRVDKPGDAPTDVQVLSVNALDATVVWQSPQFPNLPITSYIVLVSKDAEEDKSVWLQYESITKETQLNRMLLSTTNFEKSTEYFVCVRAKNAAGIGPISQPTSFITLNGGPDSPPTDVKILINEANQVIMTWQPPNSTTNVTGYYIYYTRDLSLSNDDYKDWQFVEINNEIQKYKFDHSVGLKPKTFYRVRISARNMHADGPASQTVEFETAYSELPIPTDLRTEVLDDNTIHIRFSAVRDPDDHSKAIERYRIDMAATEDVLRAQWKTIYPKSIKIDELTSIVDIVIDGDTMIRNQMYWVKATAKIDNPAWGLHSSKPRWFRTGHGKLVTTVELDGAPLIEKEPNMSENLELRCTGIGSPAPLISWEWNGRQVENSTDGWTILESNVDENTLVSVLRRSSVQESGELTCLGLNNEWNATQTIEVRVLGPGSPPEKVELEAYRNQINVTWMEPKLPNGDIMKYIIYFSENQNDDLSDWNKFETPVLETYIDSFGPETLHFVRVQAVSDRGPGIISDVKSCLSDVLYEAIKLELLATNIVDFEAEPNQNVDILCRGTGKPRPVLWYQFGDNEEHVFDEIEISAYDGETFEAKAPQINSRSNISVKCRAENKYENLTIMKTIIIRSPGEAPSNISWNFEEADDSTLFIDWKPISYPNGEKLEYNLYLSNFKTKVSGPPVRIPELPLNVTVSLRISAENEYGEGEKSFPISIPTPNGGPKTPPILSSLHAQDGKVYLAWKEPRLPNGVIQNYSVYLKKDRNESETAMVVAAMENDQEEWKKIQFDSNTTMTTLDASDGLEHNQRYQLKMTATNERNEGPSSKIYTFDLVSFDENDYISNFTATVINSTVTITVADPIYRKYNIYIRDENSQETFRHEVDVDEEETRFSFPFQLDPAFSYKVKLSGMKFGRESPPTDEIDLLFNRPTSTVTSPRRNIVKEPPL